MTKTIFNVCLYVKTRLVSSVHTSKKELSTLGVKHHGHHNISIKDLFHEKVFFSKMKSFSLQDNLYIG
jgi:hypothetical protein